MGVEIDAQGAQRAFERLQPRLDAVNRVKRVNVSLQKAVIFAAATGRMVRRAEVRERFALLSGEVFDMAHVDAMESAALALWHAMVESKRAAVQSSHATLDRELVAQATALERRMARVLAYHLGDDGAVTAELQAIRRSTGHMALASKLMRLARLYEAHGAALAGDSRHYRATDREQASRMAHLIMRELGKTRQSDAATWASYVSRAWTLLFEIYDEVSAAGRFLFRHEDGATRFPSLTSVSRAPRGSASGKGAQSPQLPESPALDGDLDDEPAGIAATGA